MGLSLSKKLLGKFCKCFPAPALFSSISFFSQNIWHSILEQFHFQYNFRGELTQSLSKKGTNCLPWTQKRASSIWMHSRCVNKYLYFSNSNLTMNEPIEKNIILIFTGNYLIRHSQRLHLLTPQFTFFAHISSIFLQIPHANTFQ